MSIIVNNDTRLVVQGITGKFGSFHAKQMLAYGTKLVAGVTRSRRKDLRAERAGLRHHARRRAQHRGQRHGDLRAALWRELDAILEAADSGVGLIVCITEGIPVMDMLKVRRALEHRLNKDLRLIGPNCPGVITPGQCKIGIMPGHIHQVGHIGVVSRSGTLTYEAVGQLSALGIGQSTCVGIGGDPVNGTDFIDVLQLFNEDPDTHGVIMISKIGGGAEERAAEWVKANMKKPVAGFIAGTTAPPGKRMGHAGAVISGGKGRAIDKIEAFEAAGIKVAATPAQMAETLVSMM
ncbi:MAG: succinate--CoA ligase subunit alpha [Polyangiales bacterium]